MKITLGDWLLTALLLGGIYAIAIGAAFDGIWEFGVAISAGATLGAVFVVALWKWPT